MQEDNEYKYWNEQAKEKRRKACERRTDWMKTICEESNITINQFAPNSYRLSKEGFKDLNYYPPSGRFFYPHVNRWEILRPDNPTTLIKRYFLNPPKPTK